MGSELTTYSLGEVCSVIKRGISPKYIGQDGICVINQRCIRDQRLSFENCRRNDIKVRKISEEKYLQIGDIVINSTGVGTLGRVAQIKELFEPTTADSHVTIVRLSSGKIDLNYFAWTMRFKELVFKRLGEGSTGQTELSRNRIKEVEIVVPCDLSEQKAIAHILGSLDDKIELNRKMNSTLESMAQALFKSWFVDFDPVIDKALAAGNPIPESLQKRAEIRKQLGDDQKSLPADIAKHFLSTFVFSEEMGWIPEGWEVSSIGEETQIVGGGTPSTKNPDYWIDGLHPWVTPKDLSALNDKVLLSSNRFLTTAGLQKTSSGLLPKYTVLMSSRAPVGYLVITQIETAINQGFIAMKCNRKLPPEYVIQWANSVMDTIKQVSSGSTFAEISKRAFRPFKIIVPSREIINAYKSMVTPIYLAIADNVAQNKNLSDLRDLLLPKLISGEIRVGES